MSECSNVDTRESKTAMSLAQKDIEAQQNTDLRVCWIMGRRPYIERCESAEVSSVKSWVVARRVQKSNSPRQKAHV